MEKLEIKQEVAKESYELALALANVARAVKVALADGFQAGQDLPVIITAAISELPKAIDGMDKIKLEAAEPVLLAKSLSLPMFDLVQDLIKKNDVVA